MKRRDFLTASAVAGVATVCGAPRALAQTGGGNGMPKLTPPETPAQLNLSLQWGTIPGNEIKQKLDYLEAHGYQAFETPTGDWLLKNGEALKEAVAGRKLFVATACGGSNFAYAEKEKRDAEVANFLPQLEVLGAVKSVGLIVCPARGKLDEPGWLSGKDLRKDFVENTGKRLAEHAAKHGTSIVLEPLRRGETPFLRQVADGAAMARDIGPGATVMGDFWHMAQEETSFLGAFISAGKLLAHVHIASLKGRKVPGVDGDADNYVDGFKGLKLIGYRGAVSLEGGFPKDSDKEQLLANMQRLLKEQWELA
ncbi:MAG: sugar phosphate isomerase/epimerase [Verrucomicrobiota bacterium]|jgi:sugar phosphate isomerase/epimerase|nr:sugar phosphate isomerase/epimerase [Verrucomicrobiota bacterium]